MKNSASEAGISNFAIISLQALPGSLRSIYVCLVTAFLPVIVKCIYWLAFVYCTDKQLFN